MNDLKVAERVEAMTIRQTVLAVTGEETPITDESVRAWESMGISKDWQIKRIADLARMFERRLAQLDPDYRIFPYGRRGA